MVGLKAYLSVAAPLVLAAGAAQAACPPLPTDLQFDRPVWTQPGTCAFDGAAENDIQGSYAGGEVVVTGAGQVGQVLVMDTTGCDHEELLLIVDCQAGTLAAFFGTEAPVNGPASEPRPGGSEGRVANIMAPKGPFPMQGDPLTRLIALAAEHDIAMRDTAEALFIGDRAQNRFDPFCGCKLHFPDSAGATQ